MIRVACRRTVTRELRLDHLLQVPDGDGPFPLVLYLHGAGAKGDDLGLVAREALPQRAGGSRPIVLACPQCPAARSGWPIDDLMALLDHLLATQPIDPRRVVVTGVSMGGRGAWEMAYDHAGRLAGIVPVCAFAIPTLAPRVGRLPVWMHHGDHDAVVPISSAERMYDAMTAAGAPPRFTRHAGCGHDLAGRVYDETFWAWAAGLNP